MLLGLRGIFVPGKYVERAGVLVGSEESLGAAVLRYTEAVKVGPHEWHSRDRAFGDGGDWNPHDRRSGRLPRGSKNIRGHIERVCTNGEIRKIQKLSWHA